MLQPVDPFHLFNVLAFWTMAVPAGVIGMLPVSALVAFILMSAKRFGEETESTMVGHDILSSAAVARLT